MTVRGEEYVPIFLKLMKLVVEVSGIEKPFEQFRGKEQSNLSKRIHKKLRPNDEFPPISANAIRDYRLRCFGANRTEPFFIASEKLDILCSYIIEDYPNYTTWSDFLENHGGEPKSNLGKSFYTASNIFELIQQKTNSDDSDTISRCENALHLNKNSAELNFNLGIYLLDLHHYKRANVFFKKCAFLESQNPEPYFFRALCLLEGKRPFRHKKALIDQLIRILEFAIRLQPENPIYQDFLYVIYTDFHKRIGFSLHGNRIVKPIYDRPVEWMAFLSKCSGLSEINLNTIFQ
ncbi:hypothetical protein [Spongiimicrobium salis]|uniref:hypothetical protein n=1 Tax=Spongiimicrobium salis TaxID=1667022 RepID=UPI00374D7CC7